MHLCFYIMQPTAVTSEVTNLNHHLLKHSKTTPRRRVKPAQMHSMSYPRPWSEGALSFYLSMEAAAIYSWELPIAPHFLLEWGERQSTPAPQRKPGTYKQSFPEWSVLRERRQHGEPEYISRRPHTKDSKKTGKWRGFCLFQTLGP